MGEREELLALADRIDSWTPSKSVLVFIARERRMIVDALRGCSAYAQGSLDRSGTLAWIEYADNGNIRFWTDDEERAQKEVAKGRYLHALDLGGLMALASIGRSRAPEAADAGAVAALQAEVDRLTKRLDHLAVGFDVPDGGRYIADWQTRIDKYQKLSTAAGIAATSVCGDAQSDGTVCDGVIAAPPAASADENLSDELTRLVDEWRSAYGGNREEAWNLIADFTCCNWCSIVKGLNALSAPVAGADAGMRERAAKVACDGCENTGWCHANDKCYLKGTTLASTDGNTGDQRS
jgi:hypothetical protein